VPGGEAGGPQTSYLLLHGDLPNKSQMALFDREVRRVVIDMPESNMWYGSQLASERDA
jgi:hypothetical protein